MKKNEPANKADKEKKTRVIQTKSAKKEPVSNDFKHENYFQQIGTGNSLDSLTSVITAPDLSNPVNAFQKAEMIDQLHETYGNSYLQAKLEIGQPNDKYEQEADRIADQIMRMPEKEESLVNSHWSLGKREKEQSLVRKEAEPVQAKPLVDRITPVIQANNASKQSPSVTPHIESRINALEGGGQALSESTRSYFEPRFGADFSQVRVHNDSKAAETAKSINAKAFTRGKDVVFGSRQYSPGTFTGKHLLAHELTHVAQQVYDCNWKLIQCKQPEVASQQSKPEDEQKEQQKKENPYFDYYTIEHTTTKEDEGYIWSLIRRFWPDTNTEEMMQIIEVVQEKSGLTDKYTKNVIKEGMKLIIPLPPILLPEVVIKPKELRGQTKEISKDEGSLQVVHQVLDYARISESVYEHTGAPEGLSRLSPEELKELKLNPNVFSSDKTGFYAALYKSDQGEYVLAFRGTEIEPPIDWGDLRSYITQALWGWGEQYYQAMELATKISETPETSKDLTFTGHSLGGGLASAAALVTGRKAVTFNAAGLHPKTIKSYLKAKDRLNDYDRIMDKSFTNSLIKSFYVEGEILSAVQEGESSSYFGPHGSSILSALPNAVGQRIALQPANKSIIDYMIPPGPGIDTMALLKAYRAKVNRAFNLHGIEEVIEALKSLVEKMEKMGQSKK